MKNLILVALSLGFFLSYSQISQSQHKFKIIDIKSNEISEISESEFPYVSVNMSIHNTNNLQNTVINNDFPYLYVDASLIPKLKADDIANNLGTVPIFIYDVNTPNNNGSFDDNEGKELLNKIPYEYAKEYYKGIVFHCESIKKEGGSVIAKIWNSISPLVLNPQLYLNPLASISLEIIKSFDLLMKEGGEDKFIKDSFNQYYKLFPTSTSESKIFWVRIFFIVPEEEEFSNNSLSLSIENNEVRINEIKRDVLKTHTYIILKYYRDKQGVDPLNSLNTTCKGTEPTKSELDSLNSNITLLVNNHIIAKQTSELAIEKLNFLRYYVDLLYAIKNFNIIDNEAKVKSLIMYYEYFFHKETFYNNGRDIFKDDFVKITDLINLIQKCLDYNIAFNKNAKSYYNGIVELYKNSELINLSNKDKITNKELKEVLDKIKPLYILLNNNDYIYLLKNSNILLDTKKLKENIENELKKNPDK